MKFEYKVDSLRLSIPLRNCTIINPQLQDAFIDVRTNENTGEQIILKSHNGIPFELKYEDGTYVKIWIDPQITYNADTNTRSSENYLTVLANSKHLHTDYFKGITLNTLQPLFNYFMSLNVFKCSYKSFSTARYSDVDICFDFKASQSNFTDLKLNIIASCLNTAYWHTTDLEDNSGIWSPTKRKPRDQATPTKPYVKFYDKQKDMESKSKVLLKHI